MRTRSDIAAMGILVTFGMAALGLTALGIGVMVGRWIDRAVIRR